MRMMFNYCSFCENLNVTQFAVGSVVGEACHVCEMPIQPIVVIRPLIRHFCEKHRQTAAEWLDGNKEFVAGWRRRILDDAKARVNAFLNSSLRVNPKNGGIAEIDAQVIENYAQVFCDKPQAPLMLVSRARELDIGGVHSGWSEDYTVFADGMRVVVDRDYNVAINCGIKFRVEFINPTARPWLPVTPKSAQVDAQGVEKGDRVPKVPPHV